LSYNFSPELNINLQKEYYYYTIQQIILRVLPSFLNLIYTNCRHVCYQFCTLNSITIFTDVSACVRFGPIFGIVAGVFSHDLFWNRFAHSWIVFLWLWFRFTRLRLFCLQIKRCNFPNDKLCSICVFSMFSKPIDWIGFIIKDWFINDWIIQAFFKDAWSSRSYANYLYMIIKHYVNNYSFSVFFNYIMKHIFRIVFDLVIWDSTDSRNTV